jgi:hypothetical protein
MINNPKIQEIVDSGLMLYYGGTKGRILPYDESKEKISEIIDHLEQFFSSSELNFDGGERKLITRLMNIKISTSQNKVEEPQVIKSKDHVHWLSETGQPIEKKKNGSIFEYPHWNRFKKYVHDKQNINIEEFEKQVRVILRNIEDPQNYENTWLSRGLVVGNVQSGKTTNYIGLMNMAIDVGYKVIIVLAGAGNDLRKQTQIRIEDGLTGKDSLKGNNIGVNEVVDGEYKYRDDDIIYSNILSFTSRSFNGDFTKKTQRSTNFSESWSKGEHPLLFVVKKNKTVLEALKNWLSSRTEGEEKIPSPLLLIDDECDYASINTKKIDESDDPEYDPTAINKCVRDMMHQFERSSYIGYTATPYGNIFQQMEDEDGNPRNVEDKYDLFPDNFIINIRSNDVYAGPGLMFPIECDDDLSFYREVDYMEWDFFTRIIKEKNKKIKDSGYRDKKDRNSIYQEVLDERLASEDTLLNKHITNQEEDSLTESIRAFILSCAIKTLRGYKNSFNTMLIHVNRENLMQKFLKTIVDDKFANIEREVLNQDFEKFELLFNNDYISTTEEYLKSDRVSQVLKEEIDPLGVGDFTFDKVKKEIIDIIQRKKILTVIQNSTKQEYSLDYTDKNKGTYYICIGGDILSRGFTIEGLSVSYFLRHAKAQDTLLQMGRWFGYRMGYLDLCRVYTTTAINEDLFFTTKAQAELFETFDYMGKENLTPRDFGLKIANSKGSLQVTGFGKRRTADKRQLDFTNFYMYGKYIKLDKDILKHNSLALKDLISNLTIETYNENQIPVHTKEDEFLSRAVLDRYLIFTIPSETVIKFMENYKLNVIQNQQMYIVKSALLSNMKDILNKDTKFKVVIQGAKKDNSTHGNYDFFHKDHIIYSRLRNSSTNVVRDEILGSGKSMSVRDDNSLEKYFTQQGYCFLLFTPSYGFNWFGKLKEKGNTMSENEIKKAMMNVPLEQKLSQPKTYWGFGDYPVLYYKLQLPTYDKLGLNYEDAFRGYLINQVEQRSESKQMEIWNNYERTF